MSDDVPVVEVVNVIKIYDATLENRKISALQGCDLEIHAGEVVSIIGPSGAGKSTLLRVMAGIEPVSSGELLIGGYPIHAQTDRLRREFRRKYIGFFTQFGRQNLAPNMTVRDALVWEAVSSGWKKNAASARTTSLLERLGLSDLGDRKCGKLSAGEAMRISLVKAVVKKPFIVLADEPTGQLDSESVGKLIDLMQDVAAEGIAIIVATHDIRFQSHSDKNYLILNGKLASQEESKDLLRRRGSFIEDDSLTSFSSNIIIDSNNFMRIPDRVLDKLNISKKVTITQEQGDDFAKIQKSKDDPDITRSTTRTEVQPFSQQSISDRPVIEVQGVTKRFDDQSGTLTVLENIDITINKGEFVVILGPSGSGKTTLLNMIAGFEPPSEGVIQYNSDNMYKLSSSQRHEIQLQQFSYLTQNYTVHPYLSVMENAKLPLILQNRQSDSDNDELIDLLNHLDIISYRGRYPTSLSGGQQQRVSLSASLMKKSKVILADEPTANLDADLASIVMDMLTTVAESGKTTIVATHDFLVIRPGYRVIRVEDQTIIDDRIADETYCTKLHSKYLTG